MIYVAGKNYMKIQLSHELTAEFHQDFTLTFNKPVTELKMIELDALAVFLKSLVFEIQGEYTKT